MKIKEGFILKEIAGSYVVVPVGDDLVDFSLMITTNETGAFLFNLISEGKDETIYLLDIKQVDFLDDIIFMKNVIIADICCLCYGADRSIKQTYEALENNSNVVLYKEILHNKNVMRDLMDKGARVVEDLRDIKDNDL